MEWLSRWDLFVSLHFILQLPAQEFEYPQLPLSVKQLSGCIPVDRFLKVSAYGYLKGDGFVNYVTVMKYQDTIMENDPGEIIIKVAPDMGSATEKY